MPVYSMAMMLTMTSLMCALDCMKSMVVVDLIGLVEVEVDRLVQSKRRGGQSNRHRDQRTTSVTKRENTLVEHS